MESHVSLTPFISSEPEDEIDREEREECVRQHERLRDGESEGESRGRY